MWKNLILLCFTLIVAVAVAEFGLQKFTRLNGSLGEGRFLYYSENPWRKVAFEDDWVVTLQINAAIESYASYGGQKEYEYLLETNRFGFRRTRCMDTTRKTLIPVLGDSYTQGTGGRNWLDQSNEIIAASGSPYCYMNSAVTGTGFASWVRQLRFMSGMFRPPFQVIVFIADDIPRVHFFSRVSDEKIALCYDQRSESGRPEERCSPLPIYTGAAKPSAAPETSDAGLVQRLMPASSRLVSRALGNRNAGRFGSHEKLEQMLREKVRRLQDVYEGKILLIRIPSKTDLVQGYQPFKGVKDSDRLDYREANCKLSLEDFHPNDEHPNQAGYAKIARCVAGEIKGFEARLYR